MLRWGGLLLWWALLGACQGERPAPPLSPAAQAPVIRRMPGGMRRLEPPLTDVAMLRLQPDGSYQRVCGVPGPEVRTMMDGLARSRRVPR
jgi:hypothetical protein